MIRVRLPFPPTENHYRGIRIIRKFSKAAGKVKELPMFYLRPEGKGFHEECAHILRAAMSGRDPMTGPVKLTAIYYFPSMRGDLLNREKVMADTLQEIVIGNDMQVWASYKERRLNRKDPHVDVTIEKFQISAA